MTKVGRPKKHGLSNHRLNKIWRQMKYRCTNPNDLAYKNYGGKGIKICQDWGEFINFYNWAINNGYQDGLTIERKDSTKDYEPSNCEWITRAENCRRAHVGKFDKGSKPITFRGKTQSLRAWSEELGVKYITLYMRLKKMTVEQAFTK